MAKSVFQMHGMAFPNPVKLWKAYDTAWDSFYKVLWVCNCSQTFITATRWLLCLVVWFGAIWLLFWHTNRPIMLKSSFSLPPTSHVHQPKLSKSVSWLVPWLLNPSTVSITSKPGWLRVKDLCLADRWRFWVETKMAGDHSTRQNNSDKLV